VVPPAHLTGESKGRIDLLTTSKSRPRSVSLSSLGACRTMEKMQVNMGELMKQGAETALDAI
jgi:hypothetical protein